MSYETARIFAEAVLDTAPIHAEDFSDLGEANAAVHKHVIAAMQAGISMFSMGMGAEAFARVMYAATILTTERITAAVRAKSADPSLN